MESVWTKFWEALLALLVALFVPLFAGCNAPTEQDVRYAAALPIALGMAGYEGDYELQFNADGEAGLKEAIYLRSAGTRGETKGKIDPKNVTPEKMAAYAKVLNMLLGEPNGTAPTGPAPPVVIDGAE